MRKAAVVGCGKVWKNSPKIIEDNGMVDILYTMVRDPDPHVLTFALQTINVILSKEGGVVINSTMANYLISRNLLNLRQIFPKEKRKKNAFNETVKDMIKPIFRIMDFIVKFF